MSNEFEKLGQRKHDILLSAVDNFIKMECPITSLNVQESTGAKISTATLRNELNALEAMGFLKQIHTSGGRVPTTKAYRYYVSYLINDLTFDSEILQQVREKVDRKTSAITDIVNQVAKIVSETTSYPTVVLMHGFNNLEIESIKIIPLIDSQMLVLLKTTIGVIKKEITIESSEEECEKACEFLSKHFKGKPIGEMLVNISKLSSSLKNEMQSFQAVFDYLVLGLSQYTTSSAMKVEGKGVSQMINDLNPKNFEETKKVISFVENSNSVKSVLEKESQEEISFVFGDDDKTLDGCAIIRAPIKLNGHEIATLGVIGPERLNYAKVANALKILSSELSTINKEKETNNDSN